MLSEGILQFTIFLVFAGSFTLSTCNQENVAMTTFWNSDAPGALLQNLDSLTNRALQLPYNVPVKNVQLNAPQAIQKRADYVDSYEDKSAEQQVIPYDYDKAYDEFVKKYFSDALSKYSNVDNDSKNKDTGENEYNDDYKFLSTTEHDHEEEAGDIASASDHHYDHNEDEDDEASEPIGEASRKHSNKKKCKSVKRNRQKCLVCKNPRTGENSESCEYNKRKSPKNYAYKKEQNYSKYHGHPKYSDNSKELNESHDKDDDNSAAAKSVLTIPTSAIKCTETAIKNKVCYQCNNEVGEQTYKCYKQTTENAKDAKNNHDKKFHRRIHKRTVTYTVENTPIKGKIKN